MSGTWEVFGSCYDATLYVMPKGQREGCGGPGTIATLMSGDEEHAHLIAAAPKLLAFAQSIANNVVLAGSSIGAEARAVIAAATGESE